MNIKKEEIKRFFKFVLFSLSAGIIEIVSFTLLNELTDFPYWPCYLIALVLSVLWNFVLNRRYTFKSTVNVSVAMIKVAIYYIIFTPTSTWLGNYLAESLLWNEYIVTILNMLLNFVTEYLFNRFIVYRKNIDTNKFANNTEKSSD